VKSGLHGCVALTFVAVLVLRASGTADGAVAGGDTGAVARAAAGGAADSVALFQQMLPVLQHPRCMNCHPRANFPRQGDDRHRHTMNVSRGPSDRGAVGLPCGTCHRDNNQSSSGVPGAPDWHLAPLRMAWEGLTPAELCRALFDPQRGGLQPGQLVAHLNTGLVRWAWSPGTDAHGRTRSTPPIPHTQFVQLAKRWVDSGAGCPEP
jgi:hypothetical protein